MSGARSPRRIAIFIAATTLATVVLGGCGTSRSPSMLDPKGTEARHIAGVWWLMFGIASGVYLIVAGLIVFAIRKGRADAAETNPGEARSPRFDDRMITWGGVVIPVLILLVLAVVTVRTTNALRRPEPNALKIDVVGRRWWWAVSYPSIHFDTANDIHIPAGRPIEIHLSSDNVIHSFWVPQLAGKLDTIPGQDNVLRFSAQTPGTYEGECAEFCGIQHAHMGFVVVVQSAGDFGRWLAEHTKPPIEPASEAADEGEIAFNAQPCAGCHTIAGTQAQGILGPDLTDLGERPTLGAGAAVNTPANLSRWITDAPSLKPGVLMPKITLSSADVRAIVAYLESLKQMTTVREPPPVDDAVDESTLDAVWEDAPGTPGFFSTVDHKRVGIRYIVTAFFFFFSAGLLALFMRAQLAEPNAHVLSAETYNEFFTMHGTSMIFLFNTPVLAGFGNYFLPMQIGSRDMAFPRLNAFSYWIFLLSGVFLYSSFLVGHLPDGGWFAYTPLTSRAFSPGINLDFWGLGVVFVGISTTVGAVNFIVTTFKMRAPGMTLNRLPIFVWSMLVFSFMVIFSVPAVTVASGLLELDRIFGTQFYNPAHGGSTLLYQHLFWFWGHPEVYILFIPATGMISAIIPVFSRRALAGYLWIATALVSIGFISFGVWVHHMFATGLPPLALSFFSAVSLLITVPSGVQFFAWIATMWKGTVRLTTAMLFAIGFLLIFLLGGITGVMVAVLPFDWQVTDSYFVVADFHYVLNGAVVFPIFGALYYWLPKMTGRMLSERLGKISFWAMFIGFNVTFFPMHILGFLGMPRRVYTYDSGLGWGTLNMISSLFSVVFAAGTLLTLYNIWRSLKHGEPAGPDPWEADTLEWATASPPPDYNFEAIPVVTSRHPLWDQKPLTVARSGTVDATRSLGTEGALERSTALTSGLRADPADRFPIPEESILPFALAVGIAVVFVGLLIKVELVGVLGVVLGVAGLLGVGVAHRRGAVMTVAASEPFPTILVDPPPAGAPGYDKAWWGMLVVIATEAMIFLVLLAANFFLRGATSKQWPPPGVELPELFQTAIFTAVLLGSSIPIFWVDAAIKRGRMRQVQIGLAVSWLMGASFLVHTGLDFEALHFGWRDSAYGSIYYTIIGLHALHVIVGLLFSALVQLKIAVGRIDDRRHLTLDVFSLYWHFVDVVWIFVFSSLILSVHLR